MNPLPCIKLIVSACVLVLSTYPGQAQETPTPQSTFTFQGTLTSVGEAATGPHDFEFRLYDAESGGNVLASSPLHDDVPVSGGNFAVMLNFGSGPFTGEPRWIEVAVRPGAETGAFTTLQPRQPVAPTPYAMRALSATGVSVVSSPLVLRVEGFEVLKLDADGSGHRTTLGSTNTIDPLSNNSSILGGLNNSIGASAHTSLIGSGEANAIRETQLGSVIGGGSRNEIRADNQYAVISGGRDNRIGVNNLNSIVIGGAQNIIGDNVDGGFIGGGFRNDILGSPDPTKRQIAPLILGGSDNEIGRHDGTQLSPNRGWGVILGGDANRIGLNSGFAVIAGGLNNLVADNSPYSFAAGRRARVNHPGAFVWSDGQNLSFASAGDNTFNIRAAGGVHLSPDTSQYFGSMMRQMINLWADSYGIGIQSGTQYYRVASDGSFSWHRGGVHSDVANSPGAGGVEMMRLDSGGLRVNGTFVSASDRGMKENFRLVDPQTVLEKVTALPLSEWNYREDAGTRHIGPMAQDFHAAFGVGPDDRHIATVDADGVALAAIQGLNQKLEEKQAEVDALRDRVERLEQVISTLTAN